MTFEDRARIVLRALVKRNGSSLSAVGHKLGRSPMWLTRKIGDNADLRPLFARDVDDVLGALGVPVDEFMRELARKPKQPAKEV